MRDLVVRLRDEADYQIEASARGINAFVTPNIRILLRGAADALMTAEREIAALHDAGWTVSSKLEAAERELAECRGKRDDKAEARAEEAERVIDAVRQTIEWRGGESLVITEALAAYDKKKNPDSSKTNPRRKRWCVAQPCGGEHETVEEHVEWRRLFERAEEIANDATDRDFESR
jgi:hypothetical protein